MTDSRTEGWDQSMMKIPEPGHQRKFWLLGIAEYCILLLTCDTTTKGTPVFDTGPPLLLSGVLLDQFSLM